MLYDDEEPDCRFYMSVLGDCNVCYPNTGYSCHRCKKDGKCLKDTDIKLHMGMKKDDRKMYLCNQACGITQLKFSYEPRMVTCKNCLRAMSKMSREEIRKHMAMLFECKMSEVMFLGEHEPTLKGEVTCVKCKAKFTTWGCRGNYNDYICKECRGN